MQYTRVILLATTNQLEARVNKIVENSEYLITSITRTSQLRHSEYHERDVADYLIIYEEVK